MRTFPALRYAGLILLGIFAGSRLRGSIITFLPPVPTIQPDASVADPALARLTVTALIDRLALEDPESLCPRSHPSFDPGTNDPVFNELVRRGTEALPALLEHLPDARSTRVIFSGVGAGPFATHVYVSGDYDPRQLQSRQHRPGTPRRLWEPMPGGERRLDTTESYTLKIGDLCQSAVGLIVNRFVGPYVHPDGPAGGAVGVSDRVIHSPIVYPALAARTRADWSNLSAREHEASLVRDIEGQTHASQWGALLKLLFYYPASGHRLVARLLQAGPNRKEIVIHLQGMQWDGLDNAVWKVFREESQSQPRVTREGIEQSELALACAERFAGRAHADEITGFAARLLAASKAALADPTRQPWPWRIEGNEQRAASLLAQIRGPAPVPAGLEPPSLGVNKRNRTDASTFGSYPFGYPPQAGLIGISSFINAPARRAIFSLER